MSTMAQNRWIELITIDETSAAQSSMPSGWRWCYEASCISDADGTGSPVAVSSDYISDAYGSASIPNLQCEVGSLVGMFVSILVGNLDLNNLDSMTIEELDVMPLDSDTIFISEPFKIGAAAAIEVPTWASQLVLGFHDEHGWADNHGSQSVGVIFDGAGAETYTVYATQCLYFHFAGSGLLGPSPYYEDIDNGTAAGSHRPLAIDVPIGATLVSITSSNITPSAIYDNQLKLQRHLFNPLDYSELQPREMLWKTGLNASQYNAFLRRNGNIDNVAMTFNCMACNTINFTVVAINKSVNTSVRKILNALDRTQILPRRTY
jgi:hypothetical protein